MKTSETTLPAILIQPSSGWAWLNLKELWKYRELLYFLTWRDIKVRYKQTLLGAGWAILKPFLGMVIFSVIFGRLAGIPTDGIAAPVFYFTGLLPWTLFQDGLTKASTSLVTGRNLVTKVYFPRLIVPSAHGLAGLVDFLLSALVLAGMMFFYGTGWPAHAAWAPVFVLLTLMTTFGASYWLAALNVSYRDVGYVTPFLVQAWLYASPVAYSATLVPTGWAQWAYALNPMVGAIQGFRWSLLGAGQPSPSMMLISGFVSLLLLLSGLAFFRRTERTFADVV